MMFVAGTSGVEHPVAPTECALPSASRAGCYGQEWTAVPTNVPSGSGTDGPLAGNGDFGVVLSGGSGSITLFTGELGCTDSVHKY
jgi:hypothetical protein